MSAQDDYLQSQLAQILQPGERVLHTAYMRRQPGLLLQILLVGGLLLFLLTKAYFAVLTNRRLILIRTKMGWLGGPALKNLGIEQYDAREIQNVTVSGFANNRSMTFHLANGPKQTLRISPWLKQVSGTKEFFENVPALVTSGQLAQLAGQAGHAQMPQQAGGYGQAPQPGGYAQAPQPGGYAQAPQPGGYAQAGFAPGSRVVVAAQDGNRYPATVVQAQNGHYLCAMPNGQQHWFPAHAVGRG